MAYLLFVVVGLALLGALALIGETSFNRGGVIFVLAVAAWLGRRSRTAWWLFVAGNALGLLFSLPLIVSGLGSRGQIILGNAIALTLGSSLLLAILLSRPMRAWVRPAARA